MENKESLISVIVPVYNVEQYLSRCIESIINQTYSNLEIILINDGSTDNSGRICDDYAKEDFRIKVIHKENGGVSSARNTGLKYATGECIGFVDADDYIHSDMYKTLWEIMQEKDVDVVTCSYCFDKNGRTIELNNLKDVPNEKIKAKDFFRYIYERDNYKGVANYLWTKLYKKNVIRDNIGNSLQFDDSLQICEDIVFNTQVISKCENIIYVNKPLYFYVQQDESVTHNWELMLNSLSIIRAYEKIINILENEQVEDDIVDLVKRFYVYWCGRHLEQAIKEEKKEIIEILQSRIKDNLIIYLKTNMEHLDRVQWIINLLLYKE